MFYNVYCPHKKTFQGISVPWKAVFRWIKGTKLSQNCAKLILSISCIEAMETDLNISVTMSDQRWECVYLTKWHQYIFSVSLKFGACYITGQWGKFKVKNATICLHIPFWCFVVVFQYEICVFIFFNSFFDKVSNFRNIILTN